jgi:hypothetical protein
LFGVEARVRRVHGWVRFPIYHIPPTDCPYKTDISFYNLRYRDDELAARLAEKTTQFKMQDSPSIVIAIALSQMVPDQFGVRHLTPNPGVFEGNGDGYSLEGHAKCRSSPDSVFMNPSLTSGGPFCFVNATDPRAVNHTHACGWFGDDLVGNAFRTNCPHVTPVTCGVNRCAPNTSANAETACARSPSGTTQSPSSAQLLMANGGMELWEPRSNRNGFIRNSRVTRSPPNSWANVEYQVFPDFVDSLLPSYPKDANPEEPRFWDLCLYTSENVGNMGVGFNATTHTAYDLSALLHAIGALVLCDPVHPRAEGISLSQVSPGRGGVTESSAARVAFVKVNDTASLKAENGAMASMVPGATHVARAWVRCAKGSSTVALVVSKLPKEAPVVSQDIQVSMFHYDAMTNVSVGGESTTNTVRCDVDPAAYTSSSDASESASGWVELEVAVSSTEAEHDITVQLIVQSHSNDAAVLMDDVSWELATSASPRMTMLSDSSSAASVFATTCAGGGGGGVSYTDAHKCSTDPTRLFYRLREMGGVPVAYEQVHAMVVIGYKSVRCRRPTLDALSQAECPFLSEASLPHLSADDVRAFMDTLTDAELEAAMRWGDVSSRGPGVRTSLAIEILRAGLPDAIEKGAVRVLDGPAFNIPTHVGNYIPSLGPLPAPELMWFAMSSTTSWQSMSRHDSRWRQCADNVRRREAICDILSITAHLMGCHVLPALMQIPGWEELVSFEGPYSSKGELSLRPILHTYDHTATIDFSAYEKIAPANEYDFTLSVLPDSYHRSVRTHMASKLVDGSYMCSSSFRHFFDLLNAVASAVLTAARGNTVPTLTDDCMHPAYMLESTLILLLPNSAPAGGTCKTFDKEDYAPTMWANGFHAAIETDSGVQKNYGSIFVKALPLVLVAAFLVVAWAFVARFTKRRFCGGCHQNSPRTLQVSPRTLRASRLIRFIGHGAESEVYLAEVTLPGGVRKLIATKMFFRPDTAKAEINFYERMPRHEHILTVLGCYFDKQFKRHCMAMEYCRHEDVRVCMEAKTFPRDGSFTHRTLSELMGALSTLHANGMVHRDLKLDNVLLSCECEAGAECVCLRTCSPGVRAKLSDFAMSRDGKLMDVSSANIKGTVMYIAPERVEYDAGKHEADFYFRGDVYALGLMTWEMLHYLHSGEVVSCAEAILPGVRSPQDVLIRIAAGTFVPPCDFLPPRVHSFLRNCWHFDPSKRYRTVDVAREFWDSLREDLCALGLVEGAESNDVAVRVDAR